MVNQINFSELNRRFLPLLPTVLKQWVPHGKTVGDEYVGINPTRRDKHPGSFKINLRTGKWADFATGDRGGDVISLVAYLSGNSQGWAAKTLQQWVR